MGLYNQERDYKEQSSNNKAYKNKLKKKDGQLFRGGIAETSNSKLQKAKVYRRSSDIGKGEC